jgi:hypothetical protein
VKIFNRLGVNGAVTLPIENKFAPRKKRSAERVVTGVTESGLCPLKVDLEGPENRRRHRNDCRLPLTGVATTGVR